MKDGHKETLREYLKSERFKELLRGTFPTVTLFAFAAIAFLLRDVFLLGAFMLFHGGVAMFAWMTAWELVQPPSLRRSLAWSAAFAMILVSETVGLRPSIYLIWVVFSATFAFAWFNTRSFECGTESVATLARDWMMALFAGSAAVAYAVVASYHQVEIALVVVFVVLPLMSLAQTFWWYVNERGSEP
jgi:hypothetical protein